ncbi:MAG: acyltransferase family protein [Pseudomonadota bacterium]
MLDAPASARRYDVDALRALAVLLLIVFHTARLFDSEPWHIKDMAAPYWPADLIVRLLNLWQMPLLFLLAGMSAAWALQRRSSGGFALERAARLLVPLLIGMVLFVAPQVWVERTSPAVPLRMSPLDFDGSPLAFAGPYFQCCYPAANLSWHHLWFLPYLFVYSIALLLVARGPTAAGLARWLAGSGWRLASPAVVLFGVELVLRPSFPSTHDLINDWANHAHYGLLVLLGWWIASNPVLEMAIGRAGIATAAAAASFTAAALAATGTGHGGFGLIELPWEARLGLRIAAEWSTLLALLAAGRWYLTRPVPGLVFFAPLALGFYILHQTIIVLLGWTLLDWSGEPVVKSALIAIVSVAASLGLAWLGAQFVVTRLVLGLRRPAAGERAVPGELRPGDCG